MKGGSDHDNVENGVTHGAAVLVDLVLPWANTHRMVSTDSYFLLVTSAELLYINGLKFIGVLKTETSKYLMAHLASQEPDKRGDMYAMVKRDTSPYGCDLLAYVQMDQDHRYFIASGSYVDAEANMERNLSCQLEDVSTNAYPVDVTLMFQVGVNDRRTTWFIDG